MRLLVRKDVLDDLKEYFLKRRLDETETIEKSHKYIYRYKKGDSYVYIYPKNVQNKTRTGAKKELTQHSPIIQGLEPLYNINEGTVNYWFNELKRLSTHGELVCPALGNDNIFINEISKKHTEETCGALRIPEAKNHKQRYLPFIADILKHGKLIEKSKNGRQTIYGIGGKVRYFDKELNKERTELVEVAVGYDSNSKKYYLSVGNYEIKKSLTTKVERDFEFISYVFDMNHGTL